MNVLTADKHVRLSLPHGKEILKLGILFLISRASLIGAFPFGLAFWGAVIPQKIFYPGLIIMLLGIFSAGGEILRYSLAAGLYLVYTYFRKNKLFDPIFCGFFVFLSGIVSILFNRQSALFIAAALGEGIISALTSLISAKSENFFNSFKNITKVSQKELLSTVLLCGILLTGFSGIYITDKVHVCTLLGIYLVLCLSKCTSIAASGSIGTVLGFICSMNTDSVLLITSICGIGAMLSNILKEFGKPGCLLGFFIGGFICIIYTSSLSSSPITVYEAVVASFMFTVTPKSLFSKTESILARTSGNRTESKELRIKEYLSEELKDIAKAFTNLAESFFSLSHREEQQAHASDMFDEVAERICSSCSKWGECWIDGFNEMYKQMYEILKVIETSGYCDISNLPIIFKDRCIRAESFIIEFNHLYELYKQNAMWHGEVIFGQDMVARQYHEISNLIKGLSDEVESGFSFIESAELKLDSELEKAGIFAREINVIENIHREPEVYISSGFGSETELLEKIVSKVIGIPMMLENDSSSMKFVAHNKYFVEYAFCQHSGESEQLCGDTILQFENEHNKFCVLLCDGMGLGNEAFEESKLTAELFQDFIKAGFIKDTAVKMINSTLAMKAGKECFSTIDLIEIDLRSGQTEFLKVGAAESYLMQKNEIEIISTQALPIGILDDISTPTISRTLKDGDIIVMMSDGISETGYGTLRGTWIKQIILNHIDDDMQSLADDVLKNARKKAYPNPCDDMTVAVMKLKKIT